MKDNKKRIITGIIMFVILVPFLFFGGIFTYVLACILSSIACFEVTRMYISNKNCQYLKILLPILSLLIVAATYFQDKLSFIIVIILLISFLSLFIIGLLNKNTSMIDVFSLFGILLYISLGFSLMAWLRTLVYFDIDSAIDNNPSGLIIFSYLLITTLGCDMGAYCFGNIFGKHKLCPTISPNKSIEGAIGGSIFGSILGIIFLIVMEKIFNIQFLNIVDNRLLSIILLIVISIIITILSQIGDLIASKLKREYQIKDYGNIFPGHGGVMDRFDSLLFSTYGLFLILFIIYLL